MVVARATLVIMALLASCVAAHCGASAGAEDHGDVSPSALCAGLPCKAPSDCGPSCFCNMPRGMCYSNSQATAAPPSAAAQQVDAFGRPSRHNRPLVVNITNDDGDWETLKPSLRREFASIDEVEDLQVTLNCSSKKHRSKFCGVLSYVAKTIVVVYDPWQSPQPVIFGDGSICPGGVCTMHCYTKCLVICYGCGQSHPRPWF